jgi:uncharacterized coiled-coil protein SlyX
MNQDQGIEIDPARVIDRLARRIAELEVECAKQDALIQQLAAKGAEETAAP